MSTSTNGRHVVVVCTVDHKGPCPDPLTVQPDDVTTDDFHFGLAVLLVFVAVVAWLVTRGA